jgi:hypothetical protein
MAVVNLRPQQSVVATIEQVKRHLGESLVIRGRLEGDPGSRFVLALEPDAVAGWFFLAGSGETYRLRFAGGENHYLYRLNNSVYPDCAGVARVGADGGGAGPAEGPLSDGSPLAGACSDVSETIFDVMIVYSDDARSDIGSVGAMNAEVLLGIEVSSETYANTDINARMRLVWRGEATYDESGTTFDEHLDQLIDDNDGILDWVHDTRGQVDADFVCLWLLDDENGDTCGLAGCSVGAEEAFSVVPYDCAVDNYSMAHEIGHNIGCAHDRDNDEGGCGYYSDSYGWNWDDGGDWYHTVMSYAPNDDSQRIPYYSSDDPNVTYLGTQTGNDDNENDRAIEARKDDCEDFHLTRMDVWVDFSWGSFEFGSFSFPYSTVADAHSRILYNTSLAELPVMHLKEGSTPETFIFNKPMLVTSCGGSAIIGN